MSVYDDFKTSCILLQLLWRKKYFYSPNFLDSTANVNLRLLIKLYLLKLNAFQFYDLCFFLYEILMNKTSSCIRSNTVVCNCLQTDIFACNYILYLVNYSYCSSVLCHSVNVCPVSNCLELSSLPINVPWQFHAI